MATSKEERMAGEFWQGVDEAIPYAFTVTGWGAAPTAVSFKVYRVTSAGAVDVTATVATGSAAVNGDVITLPKIGSLEQDEEYRAEVKFTAAGKDMEAWIKIHAQR